MFDVLRHAALAGRRLSPRRIGGPTLLAAVSLAALGAVLAPIPASAQGAVIYPAQGQSPQQLDRDRYECHSWAIQQSGFDPTRQAAQAPPPPVTTSPLRGATRGAAIGAVGGAIGGDAGKGAAIGAATGALIGGIRRNEQVRQQQQYAAQQSGSSQATYDRAFRACLQGRGYTVN